MGLFELETNGSPKLTIVQTLNNQIIFLNKSKHYFVLFSIIKYL